MITSDNYFAVINPKGLCPSGWRVSTDDDWATLTAYLGVNAGGQLKATSTPFWVNPNTGATNTTNFNALPGGYKENDGSYGSKNYYGSFWSPNAALINGLAYYRDLIFNSNAVVKNSIDKRRGYSVRCVKN